MRNADTKSEGGTRIGGSYRRWRRAAMRAAIRAAIALGVLAGARPGPAAGASAEASSSAPAGSSLLPGPWADAASALFPSAPRESLRAIVAAADLERGGLVVGHVRTEAVRTPPALRESTDLDGVHQSITWIDGRGWIEDANGVVREATGDELAACALAHALWFHTWLDGTVPGFQLRFDPSAGDAPVLVCRPAAGGPARRIAFRRDASGLLLPDRFDRIETGTPVTTTFEDWRVVGGIRFPFLSAQRTGDPRFDLVGRVTSLERMDELPAPGITEPARRAPGDARITDASRAGAIPLERPGGLFLVRVEVEGRKDAAFLLDTGAGATVLAAEWVETAGLATRGLLEARGAAGSEAAAYVDVSSLRLPGVELADQTLVSVPLGALTAALGTPVDGILGWDFLSRFAVELDETRSRLAVRAPGSYEPRPGMERIPLRIEMNVPRVDGVLDGAHRGSFVLDTGNATRLLLHSSFAAAEGYLDRATESGHSLSGIGGDASVRQVPVRTLELGAVTFSPGSAVLAPSGSGVISLEEAIGNLGAALFTGRILALDYGDGALWVSGASDAASEDSASARN